MWRYDLGATHLVSMTSLKERRCYSAARELEGKLYVVGGYGSYAGIQNSPLTSMEVYDLFNPRLGWVTSRDKYNRKAPASMTASRWGLGLFALHGSLFAIGGKVQSGGSGATLGYTGKNEEYDIHLRTWTTRATMPTPRAFFASATHNCRVIVMGGITKPEGSLIGASTNIVEIYVPPFQGDTSSTGDYWYTPDAIKLPQGITGGVAHNSALVLQGGQVYSMAGDAGAQGGQGERFVIPYTDLCAADKVTGPDSRFDPPNKCALCAPGYFGGKFGGSCTPCKGLANCNGGCGGAGVCNVGDGPSAGKCTCDSSKHTSGADCVSCKTGWSPPGYCDTCGIGFFGNVCTRCPGEAYITAQCSGHGECGGSGTTTGSGDCDCDEGYQGGGCGTCAPLYFQDTRGFGDAAEVAEDAEHAEHAEHAEELGARKRQQGQQQRGQQSKTTLRSAQLALPLQSGVVGGSSLSVGGAVNYTCSLCLCNLTASIRDGPCVGQMCSKNGHCSGGSCVCDMGWKGDECNADAGFLDTGMSVGGFVVLMLFLTGVVVFIGVTGFRRYRRNQAAAGGAAAGGAYPKAQSAKALKDPLLANPNNGGNLTSFAAPPPTQANDDASARMARMMGGGATQAPTMPQQPRQVLAPPQQQQQQQQQPAAVQSGGNSRADAFRFCDECGAQQPFSARFCGGCGAGMNPSTTSEG